MYKYAIAVTAALILAASVAGYHASRNRGAIDKNAYVEESSDGYTYQAIRENQLRRSEMARSFLINWTGETTLMGGDLHKGYPKEPVSLKRSGSLVVDGTRSRWDFDSDVWHEDESKVNAGCKKTAVFRDGIGKEYNTALGRGLVSQNNPGMINLEPKLVGLSYVADVSFLTDSAMQILRNQETPEGNMIVVGNTDYGVTPSTFKSRVEYFFDPKHDYIVTAWLVKSVTGEITSEAHIKYKQDDDDMYVPEEVTFNRYDFRAHKRKIIESMHLFVKDFRFNESIDPSIFDLEFPPGTEVLDEIKGIEYTVGRVPATGATDSWGTSGALGTDYELS